MEAARTSGTSVNIHHAAQRNIPTIMCNFCLLKVCLVIDASFKRGTGYQQQKNREFGDGKEIFSSKVKVG